MTLLQSADNFLNNGFSIVPINDKKQANLSSWGRYQNEIAEIEDIAYGFDNAFGLAIIAGKVSGNVEVIDIDCKYDLTGKMLWNYSQMIRDNASDLLAKMCVAQTMNGGYHFIYRLPDGIVEGNKKLASRLPTESEALKGDKKKVLFETRGEGGYFAVEPTPGYAIKRGSIFNLQTITKNERDILFAYARSFDQMPVMFEPQEVKVKTQSNNGLSPFEDYNNRADVSALLIKHGWKQVYQRGNRIHFKRPGETDSPLSANYDTVRRVFYVFSTSTVFNAERGYNPTQIFTILEHNQDYSNASKDLYRQGFGKRITNSIKYVPRREQTSESYKWLMRYKDHKNKTLR
jgi:hypothetical protein